MRRSYRRFNLVLPFEVNGRTLGRSRNISLSGAFVKTVMRPAVGTRHLVTVNLGPDVVECDAQVVRHEHDGIALAFGGVNPAFERALSRVLGPWADHLDVYIPG